VERVSRESGSPGAHGRVVTDLVCGLICGARLALFAVLLSIGTGTSAQALELNWRSTYLDRHPFDIEIHEASEVMAGYKTRSTLLHWVDDNTLVFPGYDTDEVPQTQPEMDAINGFIWLWRIGEGVSPLFQFSEGDDRIRSHSICAADGILYYDNRFLDDPDRQAEYQLLTRMVGPPGEEKPTRIPYPHDPSYHPSTLGISAWLCGYAFRPEMAEHYWLPLREEHGYLHNGPWRPPGEASAYRPWYLVNEEFPQGWRLPPEFMEDGGRVLPLSYRNFHYVPHEKSYLVSHSLSSDVRDWKATSELAQKYLEEDCQPIYYVFPEEPRAIKRCIPIGPWSGFIPGLGVTQNGMVWISRQQTAHLGLFLRYKGRTYRLDTGFLDSVRVSPNGCRVAYYHSPSGTPRFSLLDPANRNPNISERGWRVRVADLCDTGAE
jgi:hypothetical protein